VEIYCSTDPDKNTAEKISRLLLLLACSIQRHFSRDQRWLIQVDVLLLNISLLCPVHHTWSFRSRSWRNNLIEPFWEQPFLFRSSSGSSCRCALSRARKPLPSFWLASLGTVPPAPGSELRVSTLLPARLLALKPGKLSWRHPTSVFATLNCRVPNFKDELGVDRALWNMGTAPVHRERIL